LENFKRFLFVVQKAQKAGRGITCYDDDMWTGRKKAEPVPSSQDRKVVRGTCPTMKEQWSVQFWSLESAGCRVTKKALWLFGGFMRRDHEIENGSFRFTRLWRKAQKKYLIPFYYKWSLPGWK
jgi:hypothetical protein